MNQLTTGGRLDAHRGRLRNKAADQPRRQLVGTAAGLAEQNIGAMVVGAEGVVGIVSERDVVRQLLAPACLARSPRLC